jgi:hypothetical protein
MPHHECVGRVHVLVFERCTQKLLTFEMRSPWFRSPASKLLAACDENTCGRSQGVNHVMVLSLKPSSGFAPLTKVTSPAQSPTLDASSVTRGSWRAPAVNLPQKYDVAGDALLDPKRPASAALKLIHLPV